MTGAHQTMHVAVIGAGMGGLAAAVRLAVRGIAVTMCEQGPRPGGKMNQWIQDGWTFDTGPSLLTMSWALRDLFADAGYALDEYLTLDPVDPVCRYTFADGSHLDVTTDTARMAANIEALSPCDVPAFFRFLAHAGNLYATAAEPFLRHPMRTDQLIRERKALFRLGFRPRDLAKVASLSSVHGTVQRFFHDPRCSHEPFIEPFGDFDDAVLHRLLRRHRHHADDRASGALMGVNELPDKGRLAQHPVVAPAPVSYKPLTLPTIHSV